MDDIPMRKLATIRTCYPEKFGVPRQPGLVPAATATLVFETDFRRPEAVQGLEGFSHVWLVFLFDQVNEGEERLSVRPPRLGGNEKLGVFATRSPFRPNRIGLSAVKLEKVVMTGKKSPLLELSGVDLVDGTAILDVKPYVPYADALPDAVGGFAADAPNSLPVDIDPCCRNSFDQLGREEQALIRETLALDPRPSYHDDDARIYHLSLAGRNLSWKFHEGGIRIVSI